MMQISTTTAEQPLIPDDLSSCTWIQTREQTREIFSRSLYHEIIEDTAFQRLNNICFLGAIDFVLPSRRAFRRNTNTRFQHTLGVAKLALSFAAKAELSEREEKLIVAAALLHDIGHAPLSHSLEIVFDSEFSINHHDAGAQVIRGMSPLGVGILRALQCNGIDPEEVISLLEGKHSSAFVHLFASPMNIDTFEGILRSHCFLSDSVALTPDMLLDGFFTLNAAAQTRFDAFWQTKHFTYHYLINGSCGILADAIARKYMRDNLNTFSRDDYFLGESQLFRKQRSLLRLLREAKHLFASSAKQEINYKQRDFYLEDSRSVHGYVDLYSRYLQKKSNAMMSVPQSLARTSECEQQCLFEAACQQ